jgi:hypothetical protein
VPETPADDIAALKAALAAERTARQEAEARASGAEAMVAHLKLLIAKLRREQYGQSAERGRKLLDQLELQLEEAAASAAEDAAAAPAAGTTVGAFTRRKPVRAPFPAHLPRERVVIRAPTACPCCGGKLAKLGETVTETLAVVPRHWKVIQTVREKFTCRSCEKITQLPAPFHVIPRGHVGPSLLAMVLYAKYGEHQPWFPSAASPEPGIGVGLQDAGITRQVSRPDCASRRTPPLPDRARQTAGRRARRACPRESGDPQSAGDRLARGLHRHCRVVAVHTLGSEDVAADQLGQRAQHRRGGADVIGQGRHVEVDAFTGVGFALPVQQPLVADLENGCAPNTPGCRATPRSPRRSITC